jgi:hypothetical protein
MRISENLGSISYIIFSTVDKFALSKFFYKSLDPYLVSIFWYTSPSLKKPWFPISS